MTHLQKFYMVFWGIFLSATSADCGNDHLPLICKLKVKLQKLKRTKAVTIYDRPLNDPNLKKKYTNSIREMPYRMLSYKASWWSCRRPNLKSNWSLHCTIFYHCHIFFNASYINISSILILFIIIINSN